MDHTEGVCHRILQDGYFWLNRPGISGDKMI